MRNNSGESSARPIHQVVGPERDPLGPVSPGLLAAFRGRLEMYRALKTIPDNDHLSLWATLYPLMNRAPRHLPLVGDRYWRYRRTLFERDMRLLNDTLAGSTLDGRYWVWGGLLLGWAREGRVLPHEIDADLAFSADDQEHFGMAEPRLIAAGFRPWFNFRNRSGHLTERVFVRHGFKFEFFCMDNLGEDRHEYHVYGPGRLGPVELVGHLPRQELEPFDFLGRTWMKPRDHELLLRTCYGDWRTPNTNWCMFDELSLVEGHAWVPRAESGN
jgi:hypothetical protein